MKGILLSITLFSLACGPAMDANNFVRNSNLSSNTNPATPDAALIKQLEEIAKESKGKVGVSAVLIETGETVGINQNERFAMQSVVKLPISMAVLENKKTSRDQKIVISKDELVPANMRSPIRDKNPNGGEMTVEELIKFAISESDGTAADVLQRVAGDAKGVQAYIDSLGIKDMQVKYTHKEFGAEWKLQYDNWLSPEAATALLTALDKAEGISKENRELLLRFMTESNNPDGRIKGMLPPGTVVAHKTGTGGTRDGITSATNDIGIITLPNGNHIAIAVFIGDSSGDQATREGAIAKITRAIFDKWSGETGRNTRREIEFDVQNVKLGTPLKEVVRVFGNPVSRKDNGINECAGDPGITLNYPGMEFYLLGNGGAKAYDVASIEITKGEWLFAGTKIGSSKAEVIAAFGDPYSQNNSNEIFYYTHKGNDGGINFHFDGNILSRVSAKYTLC